MTNSAYPRSSDETLGPQVARIEIGKQLASAFATPQETPELLVLLFQMEHADARLRTERCETGGNKYVRTIHRNVKRSRRTEAHPTRRG
jgi:hypothetical protein